MIGASESMRRHLMIDAQAFMNQAVCYACRLHTAVLP